MVTSPVSPSRATGVPAGISVAPASWTTAGMPIWAARIAVWLVRPPAWVMMPTTSERSSVAVSAGARSSATTTLGSVKSGTPGVGHAEDGRDRPRADVAQVGDPLGEVAAERLELGAVLLHRVRDGGGPAPAGVELLGRRLHQALVAGDEGGGLEDLLGRVVGVGRLGLERDRDGLERGPDVGERGVTVVDRRLVARAAGPVARPAPPARRPIPG